MNDPTAKEFIEAMTILQNYTISSPISLEGNALVASVMDGMTVLDEDEQKLMKLGWKLKRRDGKDSHFVRAFQDH